MNGSPLAGPLEFLSGRERHKWRQAERRALRDHDAQQLTTLRSLAATGGGLTGLIYRDSCGDTAPAEFVIAGKRIRAGRVHQPVLCALTQAIAVMPAVPLLAAGRYRPFWVLTFQLPTAPLAVLVDKLTVLPDGDDGSTWPAGLTPPVGVRRQPEPAHPDRLQPAHQKVLERNPARRCRIGAEVFVAGVRGRPRGAAVKEKATVDHETDDHDTSHRRWSGAGKRRRVG